MRDGIVKLGFWKQRGKVSCSKRFVRNALQRSAACSKAKSLVVHEKESFIAAIVDVRNSNGPPEGCSEVVLRVDVFILTRGVVDPTVGIQRAIAVEIVNGKMQIIGAGFHRQAYYPIAGFAIFGREVALQYFELLHAFGRNALIPLGIG